jgi:uncharacterized Fe-S cluster protein YjdI
MSVHRYEGQALTITYDAKVCTHAGECVKGLPGVFNPKAKPWVNPDGASVDDAIAAIARCPSGALGFERKGS